MNKKERNLALIHETENRKTLIRMKCKALLERMSIYARNDSFLKAASAEPNFVSWGVKRATKIAAQFSINPAETVKYVLSQYVSFESSLMDGNHEENSNAVWESIRISLLEYKAILPDDSNIAKIITPYLNEPKTTQ